MEKLHDGQHPDGIKYKVGAIMGSKWMELLLTALILCDLVLVAIEVEIDYHMLCIAGQRLRIPPHKLLELKKLEGPHGHHFQALPPDQVNTVLNMFREKYREDRYSGSAEVARKTYFLGHGPESAEGAHAAPAGGHHEAGSLVCEDEHGHHAHHISHTCHMWSIVILVIFMVEICVKIWVGPYAFWTNPFHVFDFFVVLLSLILDILSLYMQSLALEMETISVILIVCRLWRIARIAHALFEVVHGQMEHMEELEQEIAEHQAEIKNIQEKIKSLETPGVEPQGPKPQGPDMW